MRARLAWGWALAAIAALAAVPAGAATYDFYSALRDQTGIARALPPCYVLSDQFVRQA